MENTEQVPVYARDASGAFLGCFIGVDLPAGAIAVANPPADAREVWSNGAWGPVPVELRREAMVLTPMQIALALAGAGILTPAEARQFAGSGAVPAAIETALRSAMTAGGITAANQDAALIRFIGALEYRRTDPQTALFGAALGIDDAAIDALFEAGMAIV
jgi:hypothetical protein